MATVQHTQSSYLDGLKEKVCASWQCVILSDHPKPANEYHLKTGQRE
jgi:hypothetical protein